MKEKTETPLIDIAKLNAENMSLIGDIGQVESGTIHFEELPPIFPKDEHNRKIC